MNVLHIDEQRGWRGGEQQASWLIQGLVRRGHYVAVAGRPNAPFVTDRHGGVALRRVALPFANELDPYSAWRLARIVRDLDIDVLHAHTSHAHLTACLARALSRRGKVVVSRRIDFPPRNNPFNRWKYGLPDLFLSVSSKVDDVLRDFGIPESRRRVVYSSVDLARLDAPPLSRTELGVPEDALLLVTAGALVGHKDHAALIDAMKWVHDACPNARLVIAGEGGLRGELEARIRRLGLNGVVALLGHRDDVPALIRAADVYVSSSWSEGLGTSVLEALACATPVVAAVAGGIPEMVIDGETGRLVPSRNPHALANAIVWTFNNPDEARRMAQAGRRLVEERFTVDRMVEDTLRAYRDVRGLTE